MFPVRGSHVPVQILRSTKEWLDQIIAERGLRSYGEAIISLNAERQLHLPSDFGFFRISKPTSGAMIEIAVVPDTRIRVE
jgi:hypothetical protein